MYPKDGTLLVCFLGDRSAGAPTAPRVAIWREHGPPEEVHLPTSAGRMIARLALPVEPSFTGAGTRGTEDRVASALASPLPQRTARELQAALGYGKTQEWRVRRELAAALAKQGLSNHLVQDWGRIGLRDATSDVAALVGAVRHEERERALRLLEAVGDGSPQRVGLLLADGWWPVVRDTIAATLAQAQQWRSQPRPLPAPIDPTAASGNLSLEPARSQALATPWIPPRLGSRRLRRRWLIAAASILVLAGVAGTLALASSSSPRRALLPGVWPSNSYSPSAQIANLADDSPFSYGVAAKPGDTLLLRMRLPGTKGSRTRSGPVAVDANLESVSSEGVRYYTSTTGFDPPVREAGVAVTTGSGSERLVVVPSTTMLVDPEGEIVKDLPDLRPHKWDWVGPLPGEGAYFVDATYRVAEANPNSPGQVSRDSSVRCNPAETTGEVVEVPSGSVITCMARLVNLGPSVLPAVKVQIGCTYWNTSKPRFALQVKTISPAGEPQTNSFTQTVETTGGHGFGVSYVHRSAELFDASLQRRSDDLDLREQREGSELTIGPLEPGVANALFLRFKARVY